MVADMAFIAGLCTRTQVCIAMTLYPLSKVVSHCHSPLQCVRRYIGRVRQLILHHGLILLGFTLGCEPLLRMGLQLSFGLVFDVDIVDDARFSRQNTRGITLILDGSVIAIINTSPFLLCCASQRDFRGRCRTDCTLLRRRVSCPAQPHPQKPPRQTQYNFLCRVMQIFQSRYSARSG